MSRSLIPFFIAVIAALCSLQTVAFSETATIQQVSPSSKKCAQTGEMCGGIAGIMCCPGLACNYDGSHPDAGGVCGTVPPEEIFLKFDPPLTGEQRLIVPNTLSVKTARKALKVELYAGPTGTGVEGLQKLIGVSLHAVRTEPGIYRFIFHIPSCDLVSSRFIARVYWDDGKVNEKVSEPLFCK